MTLYLTIQSVPRSKHSGSVIKTSQLILYRKINSVCSEIHTKHINTLCGQNVELLNVKLVVHIVTTALQKIKSVITDGFFFKNTCVNLSRNWISHIKILVTKQTHAETRSSEW